MSTPIERLERGEWGVRVVVRDCESLKENPQNFLFRDVTHRALVQVALMPWRTSLDPFELVREDVERSTRALFERTWRSTPLSELEVSLGRTAPVGRESGFSPLVSCERVSLPGGDALSLVHRSAYRPGAETVSARMLIPVERGTLELSATAMDQLTGTREAVLMASSLTGERPPDFQRLVDDVERDAAFPNHCLSRARAAMRALAATVEVTQAASLPAQQRVLLPHSGVSVIPPPRFSLLSPGALPTSPSHATFSRVGFSVAEGPWLFEVMRVPCDGGDLEAACRAFYASWARQGVVEKSLVLTPGSPLGAIRTLLASFDGVLQDGFPLQTRARWIDRGNEAVMLALNTEWAPAQESIEMLDRAAESLEWQDRAPPSPAKPWWRFW